MDSVTLNQNKAILFLDSQSAFQKIGATNLVTSPLRRGLLKWKDIDKKFKECRLRGIQEYMVIK